MSNFSESETGTPLGGNAASRLRGFAERIERLEEEKAATVEDIKEVFAELKCEGFDVPTMRKVLKLRAMDPEKRKTQMSMIELYMDALRA